MLSHKRLAQDGHPCYQSPKSLLFGEPSSVIRPQGKAGFSCHEILLYLGRAPNAGDITPAFPRKGEEIYLERLGRREETKEVEFIRFML